MNRRLLLAIGLFLLVCFALEIAGNILATLAGLSTDTANGQGPGKAGNTPATLCIGIVAFVVAIVAAARYYRTAR